MDRFLPYWFERWCQAGGDDRVLTAAALRRLRAYRVQRMVEESGLDRRRLEWARWLVQHGRLYEPAEESVTT